ncbi:tRNA epoxyqueuosine(34) reductase QueG [Neptuniibacter sp. CAU 1671]|uniref:tRNA epoxyqueuosine(34) reductase QueG n=1 Tax=Neptuniibacter sp. CAU 1671 TaxID=3032593 RepID=UPI0023DB31CA|nr:tRNA epoxyqueuosine(34) reductase QueG [Neptuniibacter sp. CAU 1671]MDF2181905.1 tRNA epoxyqueuosine(34) reductase QueG [Neptuniibacter sp. CAU 1671]
MPGKSESTPVYSTEQLAELATRIKAWALELGFQQCGITDLNTAGEQAHYEQWLAQQYHGEMEYLQNNSELRFDPARLVPGSQRLICVRMDYLPEKTEPVDTLGNPDQAYIARYTLGRDYHKLIRKRLTHLGQKIQAETGSQTWRGFVDSAPILERPLAQRAGLGWQGKHTLILNRHAGSLFFLGELFTDLPLPIDLPYTQNHCGECTACMDVCPTAAFPEPYVLDARRCISYLTIELKGAIPEELRPLMGNRIFGCDDCQLICPWNRFARPTAEPDFQPRHKLDDSALAELFLWDEETFLKRTEGSAIRRTGFEGWLRNIAVALGNSRGGETVLHALQQRVNHPSALVREHVNWALTHLNDKPATEAVPLLIHPRKAKLKF